MKPEQLRKIDKLVAETMEPDVEWFSACPECRTFSLLVRQFTGVCCLNCQWCPGRAVGRKRDVAHRYTTDPAASDTIVEWLLEKQIGLLVDLDCEYAQALLFMGEDRIASAHDANRHVALALAFLESQGVEVPEMEEDDGGRR